MGESFKKLLFVLSKGAVQKYVSVLQRYFVQYLGGFDVTVLKEVVQVRRLCTCDVLFSAIHEITLVEFTLCGDLLSLDCLLLTNPRHRLLH